MFGFRKIRRYWHAITRHAIGEVWMLHRVSNATTPISRLRPYEIQPINLERLIIAYVEKGYEFVSIEEACRRMCSKKKCNKFVAITLDDGYEDNYHVAYPIFQRHNIPFCIYVAPALITGESNVDEEYDYKMMTIDQIFALANEPLCTLAAHTYSHVSLQVLSKSEQLQEIKRGIDWLFNITKKPIKDFSYPYGRRNDETKKIIKDLGIERAVLAGGGRVLNYTEGLTLDIPRILIDDTYATEYFINNNPGF